MKHTIENQNEYTLYKTLLLKSMVVMQWCCIMLAFNPICRHKEKGSVNGLERFINNYLKRIFNSRVKRAIDADGKVQAIHEMKVGAEYLEQGADFHIEMFVLCAAIPEDMQDEYLKANTELIKKLYRKHGYAG